MRNKRRRLFIEGLEARRVLTASFGWDGPGTGSANLTYYVGNAPSSVSQADFESAIETALNVWSDVVDIEFTETDRPGLNNSLDFTSRYIDGAGGTLAQAYFPADVNPARLAGDVQFDAADAWEVGNAMGSRAFDLVSVAVHEIGHALGLDHILEAGSILLPSISPNTSFTGLSQDDIDAIQRLYAPAASSTNAVDVAENTNNSGSTDTNITMPNGDNTNTDATNVTPEDSASEDPLARRNNPWNRFRWGWILINRFGRFNFGSFNLGRIDAGASPNFNRLEPTDVNQDSATSPVDVLLILNALNSGKGLNSEFMLDTNNDGNLTPVDALNVINRLNHDDRDQPSSETTTPQTLADGTLASSDNPSDEPGDEPSTETPSASGDNDGGTNEDGDGEVSPGDSEDESSTPSNSEEDHTSPSDSESSMDETDCPERVDLVSRFAGLGLGIGRRGQALTDSAVDSFFTNYDTGDDGLTQDEVSEFVWNLLESRNVDANGDGIVTRVEVEAALLALRQERFDVLDENGDGLLIENELSARWWSRISRADANSDGGVSLDELVAYQALTPFQRLDSNRDGGITEEEVSERRWTRLLAFDANDDMIVSSEEFPSNLVLERLHDLDRAERLRNRIGEVATSGFRRFLGR